MKAVGESALWTAGVAGVLCPLVLLGCVTPDAVARTRAASDFHCKEEHVTITELGGTSYRAEGCDHSAVYDCTGSKVAIAGYGGQTSGGTTDYVCIPERGAKSDEDEASSRSDSDEAAEASAQQAEVCRKAFQHVGELTAAWAEWHPDRNGKPPPGRAEFLGVCRSLTPKQQLCLVMPYAKSYRSTCEKTLGSLDVTLSGRLDDLFLAPP
jgi:hypothetical protein